MCLWPPAQVDEPSHRSSNQDLCRIHLGSFHLDFIPVRLKLKPLHWNQAADFYYLRSAALKGAVRVPP